MHRKHKKFLVTIMLIAFVAGGYYYFSSVLAGEAADNSLTSATSGSAVNEKISQDISFIATLTSLMNIKIDTTLFSNKAFNNLKNNNVNLESSNTSGRSNPFAPIINIVSVTNNPVSPIVTNQPIQVTDKTVTLSGIVNSSSANKSVYFEYGTTQELGKTTPLSTTQSLVGAFVSNLSSLIPKTNYFYRACAKINNITSCGEVISFTTN